MREALFMVGIAVGVVSSAALAYYALCMAGLHSSRRWYDFDESKFQTPQTTRLGRCSAKKKGK